MKIYCNSRYDSDESLLRSTIGQDKWILVKCKSSTDKLFMGINDDYIWAQILEEEDKWFTARGYLVDEYDYNKHFQYYPECWLYKDCTAVVKPLEIKTTEELKQSFTDRANELAQSFTGRYRW